MRACHALKLYMNIHAHYVIALSHARDSSGMDAKCASAINLYTVVKHATHDSPSQDLSGSFHHQCSSQLEILPAGYRSRYVRSFGVSIVSLF